MNDEIRFCCNCGWYDLDYGCNCPDGEEIFQCEMFQYYHPEAVTEFEESIKNWELNNIKSED